MVRVPDMRFRMICERAHNRNERARKFDNTFIMYTFGPSGLSQLPARCRCITSQLIDCSEDVQGRNGCRISLSCRQVLGRMYVEHEPTRTVFLVQPPGVILVGCDAHDSAHNH